MLFPSLPCHSGEENALRSLLLELLCFLFNIHWTAVALFAGLFLSPLHLVSMLPTPAPPALCLVLSIITAFSTCQVLRSTAPTTHRQTPLSPQAITWGLFAQTLCTHSTAFPLFRFSALPLCERVR